MVRARRVLFCCKSSVGRCAPAPRPLGGGQRFQRRGHSKTTSLSRLPGGWACWAGVGKGVLLPRATFVCGDLAGPR
eukprot:11221695-Lingulodinium_polyedra.AAC.1